MEKNIWTDFAKSYDVVLRNWSCYQELRDKIAAHTKDCKTILDQGCGTGIIAIDIAKSGKIVYGIDNNKDMLARAFANIEESIKDRLYLNEGNAHKLEFEDEFFDGVVSNNVLFYVDDPIAVLNESHRVLKKQGILMVSGPVPNPDIGKLTEHISAEFKKKGIYVQMKNSLDNFIECSIQLKNTGMPNTYRAKEMAKILTDSIKFEKIIEECEATYLCQSYFVAARK
jgi:ubiquinone/menaquinone biosynthesis C-methylase UbiE